ncbi:hypothetical protein [Chryseobacterium wangxinyae]|uniref:hypothetical protein n=1 Tax=Chryseobacterium sp. CY353 TaxID=2997334 RepID=UPI00226E3E1A|nr:hypothetical protein [Chryseobacterium sp. CY353]MCY0969241.1 hypothetical protein [Chryseobacterium sp. CY353]
MKLLISSALTIGFLLLSCKKEASNASTEIDSITTPNREHSVPTPDPIDTLVAAPTSDTASVKTDSTGTSR